MSSLASKCADRVDLSPLIAPTSIGIVGVSVSDAHSWGHRVVRVLLDGGYQGETFVVHPRNQFPGVTTVTSISARPNADLIVICVPASAALGLVRQARDSGAKAVVVFASDFAETGSEGEAMQAALVEAAGGMLMLGPNCFGVSNRVSNVKISAAPFLNRPLLPAGPVALIAQSGALGLVLSRYVEESGVGYSHFISVGNEATLTASQIARELLERNEVRIVMLYMETLRDPEVLAAAATRAAELGKRIVILNAGRSDAGRRAALSHTAAIAGNDAYMDALCRDFGIVRIRDDEDVKPTLAALERGWVLPESPRICVLSNSGGAGAVLADRLVEEGARVEALSDATRARIASIGMVGAGDSNPIDIGGGWEAVLGKVQATLKALEADPDLDALMVYFAFGDMIAEKVAPIARYCSELSKPAVFVWQIAPAEGLPMVKTPGILATSMGEGARMIRSYMRVSSTPVASWTNPSASGIQLPAVALGQQTVAELQSAALLTSLGIEVVESVHAAPGDANGLVQKVKARGWTRVVVKANAHDVAHRSRHDLIRIGVPVQDLPQVLQDLGARLDSLSHDPARQLIVQPAVSFEAEIGVGGLVDPKFGPILMIGPGGVDIEAAKGPRHTLLLNTDLATQKRFAHHIEQKFDLAHGTVQPIIDAVGQLLRTTGVTELDVNPMVRTGTGGLMALDALLVVERTDCAEIAEATRI
ncbi:MAG: acetate--CoA ligase family protein [Comamonadaceae bacterium]|nr:acetate--CoA ligase family protein [Comamonadaceae bacterium]